MSRVVRKALLMQLAPVETIHKELQSRFRTARKTTRATGQASCYIPANLNLSEDALDSLERAVRRIHRVGTHQAVSQVSNQPVSELISILLAESARSV